MEGGGGGGGGTKDKVEEGNRVKESIRQLEAKWGR